jgi:uncharacterized iron-regulated membrane protein
MDTFHTVHQEHAMSNMGSYLLGIAFWIFVGAVSVAGIVADYKRRRFGIEVLRMAIDKGRRSTRR